MSRPKAKDQAGAIASLSFDQAMERAEELLARMEGGELELEESLEAYEQGVALLARCKAVLAQAKQRVEEIARASGELERDSGGDAEAAEGDEGESR